MTIVGIYHRLEGKRESRGECLIGYSGKIAVQMLPLNLSKVTASDAKPGRR
jgi:hypothetical protein